MKTLSKILLYFFAVVALAWFLPWLYSLLTPGAASEPFAVYSPVSDGWILSKTDGDRNTLIYSIDSNGEPIATYTKNQRDSLVPQMYYKDLMARNSLPETISGKEISVPALRHSEFAISSSPREVNKPHSGVFLMMESMPERADLEDPSEVFTMDGKMEFVDMATNTVNESRSARFTAALSERGFEWPMTAWSANITARKQRDDGYLMVDAAGKVFHVKQRAGRPYVARVNLPDSVSASNVFIFENTDPTVLGLITDTESNPWFILQDGYKTVPLPIGKIDPTTDRVNIIGNLFNIVFRVSSPESTRWSAVSADDYSLLGLYEYQRPAASAKLVAQRIFPFRLDFNSQYDAYAYPRLSAWSLGAIWLNIVLALILVIVLRRRRCPSVETALIPVLTIGLGLFLFIPAMFIKD